MNYPERKQYYAGQRLLQPFQEQIRAIEKKRLDLASGD